MKDINTPKFKRYDNKEIKQEVNPELTENLGIEYPKDVKPLVFLGKGAFKSELTTELTAELTEEKILELRNLIPSTNKTKKDKKMKKEKTIGGMILWDDLQEVFANEMNKHTNINFTKMKYLKISNKIEKLAQKFCNHISDDLEKIAKEEAYQNSLKEPEPEKKTTNYPLYTIEHGDSEDNWYPKLVEIYGDELKYKMQAFWYEYVNGFEFTEKEYSFYKKHFNQFYYWKFPSYQNDGKFPYNFDIYNDFINGNGDWDNKEYREYFLKYAKIKGK